MATYSSTFSLSRHAVALSGAGSRGGRVIGYTRSQKAIYADHGAKHPDYRSFKNQDHTDAAKAHIDMAKQHRARAATNRGSIAGRSAAHRAEEHDALASTHERAAAASA